MFKKLAKIKYLPNNFEVIQEGEYVLCAVTGKKILLKDLTYWNVELQEAYFSYVEASIKRERQYIISIYCETKSIDQDFSQSYFPAKYLILLLLFLY